MTDEYEQYRHLYNPSSWFGWCQRDQVGYKFGPVTVAVYRWGWCWHLVVTYMGGLPLIDTGLWLHRFKARIRRN